MTAGVDSYGNVAEADAYHLAHGNSTWAATLTAAKESALVRATSYLDGKYRWPGTRATVTQTLAWPRVDAFDADGWYLEGTPQRLKNATFEAALIELTPGTLSATIERPTTREKVGAVEVEYAATVPAGPSYPQITNALAGIITSGGVRLSR